MEWFQTSTACFVYPSHYPSKLSINSHKGKLKIVNPNGKWPGYHEKGLCLLWVNWGEGNSL